MKKILVLSDTHGVKNRVEKLLEKEKYDYILFLGDGLKDFDEYESENILKVRGNCDLFSTEAEQGLFSIENVKIMLTHGHNYKVKLNPYLLIKEAKMRCADAVLFGHTHTYTYFNVDGIDVINPGSFFSGSYVILEIEDGKILKVIKKTST